MTQKKNPRSFRELVETIVFVTILVLLLKLFVVEAYVIPTGSMATTLLGYNKYATCEQCGYHFPVKASSEMDGPLEDRRKTVGYHCPNCQYSAALALEKENLTSGDRVLVHKAMTVDERGQVVVFRYPVTPQKGQVIQNYIKRLIGLGGETIAIHRGEIFVNPHLQYPAAPANIRTHSMISDNDRTWHQAAFFNHEPTLKQFKQDRQQSFQNAQGFQLFRKPDDLVMEMRRIVYDNDFQAKDLIAKGYPPRWNASSTGWTLDNDKQPRVFSHQGEDLTWIRYQHLVARNVNGNAELFVRTKEWSEFAQNFKLGDIAPGPITNVLGFNENFERDQLGMLRETFGSNLWVGDLLLEAEVELGAEAEIVFELSQGRSRFQAHFTRNKVKLLKLGVGGKELCNKDLPVSLTGKHQIRFANVDCRLRVWIDNQSLDFAGASDYPMEPIEKADPLDKWSEGFTEANDIQAPASIGVKGSAKISHLRLFRDVYYLQGSRLGGVTVNMGEEVESYYVPPKHFFCMGDNSDSSSDGRNWGMVPEHLMLGRAVFIFFPLNRIGFIR